MTPDLTVRDVAEQLHMHRRTVNDMCLLGDFPNAWRRTPRSPWRIPARDVDTFRANHRRQAA